jgi:hypothetical protein
MTEVDLSVTAGPDHIGEPILWRLGREFNVKVILKKANVDEDHGWVLITLAGPVEEIQRATSWLMTTGVHVEAQRRAVGA